jgi:hypothetical protein
MSGRLQTGNRIKPVSLASSKIYEISSGAKKGPSVVSLSEEGATIAYSGRASANNPEATMVVD